MSPDHGGASDFADGPGSIASMLRRLSSETESMIVDAGLASALIVMDYHDCLLLAGGARKIALERALGQSDLLPEKVRSVVAVARSLLAFGGGDQHALTSVEDLERRCVTIGGTGRLAFSDSPVEVDWGRIVGDMPVAKGIPEIAGVWIATQYLKEYATDGGVAMSVSLASVMRGAGVDWEKFMGETLEIEWPKTLGGAKSPESVLLEMAPSGNSDSVARRIAWAMERLIVGQSGSLREAMLRVGKCMSATRPASSTRWTWGDSNWNRRRCDAIAYLYGGLRSIDLRREPLLRMELSRKPSLCVEPWPEMWDSVLLCATQMHDVVKRLGVDDAQPFRSQELAVSARDILALERVGDWPSVRKVEDRVLKMLATRCRAQGGLGTEFNVDGMADVVRRSGHYLARVPIVSGGRNVVAVCVSVGLEVQRDGKWKSVWTR